MKTKAAVLREVNKPLSLEELEIPKLQEGQALIKVLYSGLCHSQLNEISGRKWKEHIPHLLGHEASGYVVDIANNVKKVKIGDYVMASWIKGSGADSSGLKYQSANGAVNAGGVATFTEYAVVSENRILKISEEVKPEVAAIVGCAVMTGMGIVDFLWLLKDKKVAVFGVGGIGASALMRAVSLEAKCTAVDIVDWKLEWAKNELGVQKSHNCSGKKLDSKDYDYAIECSGNKHAMENAFECIHDKGTVIIAGNLGPGEKISIDPYDLIKGKKILGSWGGSTYLDNDAIRYTNSYLSGKLQLEQLITKVYSFEDINKGLDDLRKGLLIRGVVQIGDIDGK